MRVRWVRHGQISSQGAQPLWPAGYSWPSGPLPHPPPSSLRGCCRPAPRRAPMTNCRRNTSNSRRRTSSSRDSLQRCRRNLVSSRRETFCSPRAAIGSAPPAKPSWRTMSFHGSLACPTAKIVVYGYTDNTPVGPELQRAGINDNLTLSSRRAGAVVTFLISQGIKPDVISAGLVTPIRWHPTTPRPTARRTAASSSPSKARARPAPEDHLALSRPNKRRMLLTVDFERSPTA
jgi:hypothetical protein